MSDVPENINHGHIIKALKRVDSEGIPSGAHSSTYDVIYNGKAYPPKLVISWANQYANGVELDRKKFHGGDNTAAFNLLQKEGFIIQKKNDTATLYVLWDEFLNAWPVSRVKTMSLTEYSSAGNPDSFCNWVESRLVKLGSIWGGSSFKFGIYNRTDKSVKEENVRYSRTDDYAWEAKLGDTVEEAFNNVKDHIVSVISAVQSNNLTLIDDIPLWPVFKWKISFLYQDRNAPLLPGVYKAELLLAYINNEKFNNQSNFSDLYKWIMTDLGNKDLLDFSKHIWTVAGERIDAQLFLPVAAEIILKERYESIDEGTKKIIGFINSDNKTIALDRNGKTVRLTMEPWEPSITGVKITKRYETNDSRNSNFDKQAPNVATGKKAIIVECVNRKSFEQLLDMYEGGVPDHTLGTITNIGSDMSSIKQPLNQILYGPPGTGKTYHTINAALKIIDPDFYQMNKGNRHNLLEYYKKMVDIGNIGFVTFHQSISYEDFVEGLKAELVGGQVQYYVDDGIFKRMCDIEKLDVEKESTISVDLTGKTIWKMSLGNTLGDDSYIYDHCIEANELRMGYGREIDFTDCPNRKAIIDKFIENGKEIEEQDYRVTAVNSFRNVMSVGDLVVVSDGNTSFRAIAEIVGDYQCLPDESLGHYGQTRKVVWHRVYEKSLPHERIMRKKFSQMTLYKLKEKTIHREKLQTLLSSLPLTNNTQSLLPGQFLQGNNYQIDSVTDDIVRIKVIKTNSIIFFDWNMIRELVSYVNNNEISIDDIAQKNVFEKKPECLLEKYIVNGYPKVIAKVVDAIVQSKIPQESDVKDINPNKVLIIDEINRGNISSIFGELITLIEESKRDGADEALTVTLPYSKDSFTVPRNLHIIGTMNTADRSLALMDTALRRRFDFVEMMPKPSELQGLMVKGINVESMLIDMNKRIEVLYDREHTIGHAFFISLKDIKGDDIRFDALVNIFANKIIPLLEEYFFEDWEKIRMVLADNQTNDEQSQFIKIQSDFNVQELFGNIDDYDLVDVDQKVFIRNSDALTNPAAYIKIYE